MNRQAILAGILLMLAVSTAYGADDPNNAREIVKGVIKKMRAAKQPYSGKGAAIVEFKNPQETRREYIEFEFKGELSRADHFPTELKGKTYNIKLSEIISRNSIIYSKKDFIKMVPKGSKGFYKRLGYNFQPDIFMSDYGYTFSELLERTVDGPSNISLDANSDGLLKISATFRNAKVVESTVYAIDPSKQYKLVNREKLRENLEDPNRSEVVIYQVDWKQYDSTWYPKSADLSAWVGPASHRAQSENIKIEVEEFYPNIDVNESDFYLDGLKIPRGTEVLDLVSNKTYKYGDNEPNGKK